MHLADNDILNNIAEHFGKIVHGSQLEADDGNLSVSWIGLLVGEGERIHNQVTLKWKDKLFRVWIEEECSDWVPESVGKVNIPSYAGDKFHSDPSSPQSGNKKMDGEVEKTHVINAADIPSFSNVNNNNCSNMGGCSGMNGGAREDECDGTDEQGGW
ncbi:hypothetical protein Hanom_Chr05g00389561 [Helianthus anomalus]